MKSELNARQWAVYNLLKNNPDRYMTQKEIVYALHGYYDMTFCYEQFHDSKARHTLTNDIRTMQSLQQSSASWHARAKRQKRQGLTDRCELCLAMSAIPSKHLPTA